MSFNPHLSKQTQDVTYPRKKNKVYPNLSYLIILPFNKYPLKKHLGVHLDEELIFKHHINEKINKVNKGIRVIRKLNNILPRSTLLTIYRSFVRSHLDYGDVIYDQPENESFNVIYLFLIYLSLTNFISSYN